MKRNDFAGRKVLITGGLGFIGSNFITQFFQKYPDSNITNVDALAAIWLMHW